MELVGLRSRDEQLFVYPRDIVVEASPMLADMIRAHELVSTTMLIINLDCSSKVLDTATWIMVHKKLHKKHKLDISYTNEISSYLTLEEIYEASACAHAYSL